MVDNFKDSKKGHNTPVGGGGGGGGETRVCFPPNKTCFPPKIIWQNNGNYTGIALFLMFREST